MRMCRCFHICSPGRKALIIMLPTEATVLNSYLVTLAVNKTLEISQVGSPSMVNKQNNKFPTRRREVNQVICFFLQIGCVIIHFWHYSRIFYRPLHKTRKWQLCRKLACHNLGDCSFTAGDNMPAPRSCRSGPVEEN